MQLWVIVSVAVNVLKYNIIKKKLQVHFSSHHFQQAVHSQCTELRQHREPHTHTHTHMQVFVLAEVKEGEGQNQLENLVPDRKCKHCV